MYSDYVVVVEGPTDRSLLIKIFDEDEILHNCIENKIVTIRSIGGTNNLKSEVYALQRYCCNYIVLLDGDAAGKAAANEIKQVLPVSNEKIRYFMRNSRGESELEDLYNQELYDEYLLHEGISTTSFNITAPPKTLPTRGAWIEIPMFTPSTSVPSVAPHTGSVD